ncbi:hypothetical protein MNBD_GAMMA22-535 [hydrothermal vent metagenome]|uniref:VgrG protein n=1 Tax=hydrothermal vent metagenome TaxID=652676 RepID=A0A3B1A415_9ZZZZ
MTNVLYEINKNSNNTVVSENECQIMTVTDTIKGEAVSLLTVGGINFEFDFTHAASVPLLLIGDKVIIQNISGLFVITDKLRNKGDSPSIGFEVNDDGSLSIASDVKLTLKTSNANIDIFENGKILINGSEVYSQSDGLNRIQGTSIELN